MNHEEEVVTRLLLARYISEVYDYSPFIPCSHDERQLHCQSCAICNIDTTRTTTPITTTSVMASQTVLNLKQALEKELPVKADDPVVIERCRDILSSLNSCEITLAILTETLIGATVNKLKSHKELSSTAKALVQKWKKVAASDQSNSTRTDTITTKVNNDDIKSEKRHEEEVDEDPSERRSSLKSVTSHGENEDDDEDYNPELEWQGLPDQRSTICAKLYSILQAAQPALLKQGVSAQAVKHLTGPRTAEMERAIQKKFGSNRKGYADKARSLFFNLKKNQDLAVSLLLGQIEPQEIVEFTAEQLASDEIRQKRQETAQKLIDSKRLDWDQANEDKINQQCGINGDLLNASLFTCGRCKSVKTTSTQKQTRSADEPMTVFVLCLNCGKRWKC